MEMLFMNIAYNHNHISVERFKAEYALVGYTGQRSGEHFHIQVFPSSIDGSLAKDRVTNGSIEGFEERP